MVAPWIRPVTSPVLRYTNEYQRYWSDAWMGHPAPIGEIAPVYPMVYQPTDTAQLGFYHKHVPSWHSRPDMLPRFPRPHWPIDGAAYGYGGVYAGGIAQGAVVAPAVAPAPAPGPAGVVAPIAPPEPAPVPQLVPEPEANLAPRQLPR